MEALAGLLSSVPSEAAISSALAQSPSLSSINPSMVTGVSNGMGGFSTPGSPAPLDLPSLLQSSAQGAQGAASAASSPASAIPMAQAGQTGGSHPNQVMAPNMNLISQIIQSLHQQRGGNG